MSSEGRFDTDGNSQQKIGKQTKRLKIGARPDRKGGGIAAIKETAQTQKVTKRGIVGKVLRSEEGSELESRKPIRTESVQLKEKMIERGDRRKQVTESDRYRIRMGGGG